MLGKGIIVEEHGDPEVLLWEEVDAPDPGPDEVLIKHSAVGLSYIDTEYRRGIITPHTMPFTPGFSGAGIVLRMGKNVTTLSIGDRVAYAIGPIGAYARLRVIPIRYLTLIPDDISDAQAAGFLYDGLTAHYLVRRTFMVCKPHTALVNGAETGPGLFICQWARHLGARVIGAVQDDAHKELVLTNGCEVAVNYKTEDIVEVARDTTNGDGVSVVYDAVGQDTFLPSLDCLRTLGMLISFEERSGPLPSFDPSILRDKPSLFITRPSLFDYKASMAEYQLSVTELYDMVLARHLRVNIMQSYYMRDAAYAHEELEAGNTTGSSVFLFKERENDDE